MRNSIHTENGMTAQLGENMVRNEHAVSLVNEK